VAKQAKPQADKAAQIIKGTAQGIKENAEPTAKVLACLLLRACGLPPWLFVIACCTWAPAAWTIKPPIFLYTLQALK